MSMARSAGVNSSFLIVEGVTDPRYYEKFIDSDNCQIKIAGNKDNVVEIIQTFYLRGFKGCLGIVDADFMHLNGETFDNHNIVLTDSHDLETMLINSPALENILFEYANWNAYIRVFSNRSHIPLMTALLNSAKIIGYILWASLKYGANLKFSEIDYNNLVIKPSLEINFDEAFNHIISNSINHNISDIDDFKDKVLELMSDDHDLWQVCRGHDLTEILCIGLKEVFGAYNSHFLRRGSMEGALRMTYEREYFFTTELYRMVLDWERDNNDYTVLRERDDEIVTA
jgi:hypothetical protein